MKKAIALCLILILTLCGCFGETKEQRIKDNDEYHTGLWITYSELNNMLSGDFKVQFSEAVNTCKEKGITDIFVHTRAFCDAYYNSGLFPKATAAQNIDFDALEFMVQAAHGQGIRLHAWINPYRVRTSDNNIEALNKESPAYKWISEGKGNNVLICESGIYLNPASYEARLLTLEGIREILNNYAVDGIHFDDYFYPENCGEADKADYETYTAATPTPLNIEEWRRGNVNALISGAYTAVKFINKDIIFSVSPAADIDKNYEKFYADIALWAESGCVDWVIPQLYFGFNYPDQNFCFDNLLEKWKKYLGKSEAKILIGLANYKIGTEALPDATEWVLGEEIIARQEQICKEDASIHGHCYFSYSYIK
ncbi:MAG: family 10 glycosylhydrolase [Clostridia bacterium]|nr:family 10 glycosylhydrolase [Clostridia bacterium]